MFIKCSEGQIEYSNEMVYEGSDHRALASTGE